MKKEMRRKDRKIDDIDVCKDILLKNNLGYLSTVSKDNSPYVVPLNYFYDGEFIYFHSAMEGHKIENIKNNPKVAFCVVGDNEVILEKFTTRYESIIVFGTASIVGGYEEKLRVLNNMMRYLGKEVDVTTRYDKKFIKDKTLIVKIEIETMTGKKNTVK
ncbi:pyridoxamine 5'-phosphate oxidase family protein [Sporosalibacterium faouarense]|uniref:pyridoxamine 5'-phosphate oxidase family protein n=1 Tax=Sporosalibacterium faouarense TaxID=516123 RepID=UPI00141C585D|nr:pyridoxamine 5'-phosphate oxidase family protein [Sporosalibacterium faouarense]MTI49609.1 pyridoxamine 5'-phosphate oxidase family protein [Bacillota bacterium]